MSMSAKPVYVVSGSASLRGACAGALSAPVEFVNPPLDASALSGRTPGVVLVDLDGMDASALVELAGTLPGPAWTAAVIVADEPLTVSTISRGVATELDGVERFAAHEGEGAEDLLELHRVLAEISRARHDINNPLTSALAETQILLLDAPAEGELRESLETVQTQLRRIRDLVAATRYLRPSR